MTAHPLSILLVGPVLSLAPVRGQAAQGPARQEAELELAQLRRLMGLKVYTAAKLAQRPMDAPGVVTTLSRDQLRDYGWDSLNEALGLQPGFIPSQDYERRTLSARGVFEGWNNNHLLVLVDGVPFNDNLYGAAYTWEITPLVFSREVEVMRGPGSALYGSNAVNGVVSLHTLEAEEVQGGGEARLRLGERGTQRLDLLTSGAGSALSFVAAYTVQTTQGNEYPSLDASGRTDGGGTPLALRTRDHRASDYFFAKARGIGPLEGWSFQVHQQRWSFETGHGWIFQIPDFPESMQEERRIAALKHVRESGSLAWEGVLRYQWHAMDWNQRYFPSGPVYPQGLTEYLSTTTDEAFGRAQVTWRFGRDSSLVAGLEATRFTYDGDKAHRSNVDINNPGGTYLPTPDGRFLPLRPYLGWTLGHPVMGLAFFAQVTSGTFAQGRFDLTFGLRHDRQHSRFNALDRGDPGGPHPTESLDYQQTSPRLGLVYHRSPEHTLKLLLGRAFRSPSPSEAFGANTYALASNIRQLRPETADTLELASDWSLGPHVVWRANLFDTRTRNFIAYSVANANLSTNLYSLRTRGLETELLWQAGRWSGFLNASKTRRMDETILDPTIAPSGDVTWVPSVTANLGAAWKPPDGTVALSLHRQGGTLRRTSDLDPAGASPRPASVPPFTRVDLRVAWRFARALELEAGASNVLDAKGLYAKNFQYPFDYRIDPRMAWIGLRIH